MARPKKMRKVCKIPNNNKFGPIDKNLSCKDFIIMTIDEYETIRLIDYETLTQQECSEQMNIARTTVQGIYSEARKKIAQALVEEKGIRIKGGHYKLCSGKREECKRKRCNRQRRIYEEGVNENSNTSR